jgi:Na+-translocating ferredoxin:NAD+ oxidoreductase RNF subunit RnfB
MNTLYAVIVLGALGAIFGLVLAVAAKKFAVEVDEREAQILEILPGANCGGCGYPGCAGYAAAIVKGEAKPNCCAAGGSAAAAKIGAIMGVEAGETERSVALVKCSGFTGHAKKKFAYVGIDDCVAAMRLGGGQGPNECPHGCLGFGTCGKACPFDAIHLRDGIARVDREKCVGCMTCAAACPKHIIVKVPFEADVTVACSSVQKGSALRKYCDIGCIGCKICERTCQHDAIHVVDNLAVIDYTKCVSCGQCGPKCPRGLIRDARLNTANETEPVPPSVSRYAD